MGGRAAISRVGCLILKRGEPPYLEEIKNHKGTAKSFNPFLVNLVPQKASEN